MAGRYLLLVAVLLAGCGMRAEYVGPRGWYECKDLRDGEAWIMHTDTMENITASGFSYTDSNGRGRVANAHSNAYQKCAYVGERRD